MATNVTCGGTRTTTEATTTIATPWFSTRCASATVPPYKPPATVPPVQPAHVPPDVQYCDAADNPTSTPSPHPVALPPDKAAAVSRGDADAVSGDKPAAFPHAVPLPGRLPGRISGIQTVCSSVHTLPASQPALPHAAAGILHTRVHADTDASVPSNRRSSAHGVPEFPWIQPLPLQEGQECAAEEFR